MLIALKFERLSDLGYPVGSGANVTFVPLAMPLIFGRGAIATILSMTPIFALPTRGG
jgi:small neutral amino acid transporter SnatA (MarC family)